jgi:hypothetical protein
MYFLHVEVQIFFKFSAGCISVDWFVVVGVTFGGVEALLNNKHSSFLPFMEHEVSSHCTETCHRPLS